MRYTVVYAPSAQDELARLWMQALDRQAVSDAANRIDLALAVDPQTKATPFYGDWLFIDAPLAVVFAVRADDCIVEVTQVWHQ